MRFCHDYYLRNFLSLSVNINQPISPVAVLSDGDFSSFFLKEDLKIFLTYFFAFSLKQ
jgi:hypothetical protein